MRMNWGWLVKKNKSSLIYGIGYSTVLLNQLSLCLYVGINFVCEELGNVFTGFGRKWKFWYTSIFNDDFILNIYKTSSFSGDLDLMFFFSWYKAQIGQNILNSNDAEIIWWSIYLKWRLHIIQYTWHNWELVLVCF
jgi:hypothetical protein